MGDGDKKDFGERLAILETHVDNLKLSIDASNESRKGLWQKVNHQNNMMFGAQSFVITLLVAVLLKGSVL